MIACLEVQCNGRVGKVLQVHCQHLLRDVVVVQLVVAQGNVDVEGKVLSVVQEDALVDVNCLLENDDSVP